MMLFESNHKELFSFSLITGMVKRNFLSKKLRDENSSTTSLLGTEFSCTKEKRASRFFPHNSFVTFSEYDQFHLNVNSPLVTEFVPPQSTGRLGVKNQ
ncbi:MAG TPA: hypothetical protein PLA24_10965 [Tenuifilaceae bacterium]|nr:hypothetical protein [Tenuifilaceae bacterium]